MDGQALLEAIAQSHIEFEHLHPFSDGKGRTGRLLLTYCTLKKFGLPVVITLEQQGDYLNMLQERNVVQLAALIETSLAFETKRKAAFDYQTTQEIEL